MVLHGSRFTFLLNHGENNAVRVQDHRCDQQIWILYSATHRVVRYEGTSTAAHHALTRRRPITGVYARACLLRCNRNTHFGVVRVPINVSNPTSVWMIARVPIKWGTFRARRTLCPRRHRSDRIIRKQVRPPQRIRMRAHVRIAQRDVLCFRIRHRYLRVD